LLDRVRQGFELLPPSMLAALGKFCSSWQARGLKASSTTLGRCPSFGVFVFEGGNFAPANNGGLSVARQLSGGGDAFVGGNMTD
jgi:hypothetical protein